MPQAKRPRRERTDSYALIQQWCRTPEQRLYEGIRPVVLFGLTSRERAEETGLTEATVRRAAAQPQQMQAPHEREGIQMQGGADPGLSTVICWRRDGRRVDTRIRNHGLISLGEGTSLAWRSAYHFFRVRKRPPSSVKSGSSISGR